MSEQISLLETKKPEIVEQLTPLSQYGGSLTSSLNDKILHGDSLTQLARIPSGKFTTARSGNATG
jgi:hypothetical protein